MHTQCSDVGRTRIASVQVLRGLAAIVVCWFHLVAGTGYAQIGSVLHVSAAYGYLGVQAFFVLSGFIVSLTLGQRYRHSTFRQFMAKRVLRIVPPYVAALCLSVLVGYLSSRSSLYRGRPYEVGITQLLGNLLYVADFLHVSWLNPVFWTLAIEFQFYVLLGLSWPVITRLTDPAKWGLFLLLGCLSYLFPPTIVVYHLPLFLLGMGCLQLFRRPASLAAITGMLGLIVITMIRMGPSAAVCGGVTVVGIMLIKQSPPIMDWLGAISYSLYLIHVPIGCKAVNLGRRFSDGMWVPACALMLCLLASHLFCWAVEHPAARLSKALGEKMQCDRHMGAATLRSGSALSLLVSRPLSLLAPSVLDRVYRSVVR